MNERSDGTGKRRVSMLPDKINGPGGDNADQSNKCKRQVYTKRNIITHILKDRHEKKRIQWMKPIRRMDAVERCA